MAKGPYSDKNGTYYIVQNGDTLSDICYLHFKDGTKAKYTSVAKLNKLKDADDIVIGQTIYVTGTASGSSSSKKSTNSKQVTITQFGVMSAIEKPTLFATWTWGKHSDTEKYEYQWEYTVKGTGATWWTEGNGSTTDTECRYTIPDEAQSIRFRVKPIPKTDEKKDSNGNTTTTQRFSGAEWTSYKKYHTDALPPTAPSSAPSVRLADNDKFTLIMELNDVDATALDATHIEFQIVKTVKKNGTYVTSKYASSGNVKINTAYKYVSYTHSKLPAGGEYKVRCRAVRANLQSDWTNYSSVVRTPPSKPAGFTVCKAKSRSTDNKVSVYLKWDAVSAATKYKIEYATSEEYFDITDQTTSINDITLTEHETYSLETGHTYYFRLKAINTDGGESEWSENSSVALGEPPEAPTTWSSTTTATVDGPLNLYWVHNASDGSSQTHAELALEIYKANGFDEEGNIKYVLLESKEIPIDNSTDADEKDKTSSFDATAYLQGEMPSLYKEGVQLRWRVRTSGVTNELGDWSIVRMIDVYSEPTVTLEVRDATNTINTTLDTLGSFPIYISAITMPATQSPIGFYLTIVSNGAYETVDSAGNDKLVNAGEQIYSRYFDQNTDLTDVVLSAGDVDLENGVDYTITCVAAMNSGLSAEASLNFTVSWEEVSYIPDASITYNSDLVVTHINPYCKTYTSEYYGVVHDSATGTYMTTDNPVSVVDGYPVDGVYTTTGDQVYLGSTELTIDEDGNVNGGDDVYYYEVETGSLVEGVKLAVYRREFDGSFTELANNIDNTDSTHVTDPHPALDYARYRIVATTESTGAVSYYDIPGFVIGEKDIIIQWDEDWSNFDSVADAAPSDPLWSGSMLRLPYNIDVSDSYGMDVSLVQYAGRKRPVSYYGTQLGESSTWNTVIPKDDEETLYALRRLAIWTGDVYVREPSGTGYWANIGVSFSQKHRDLTIPVTFNIKRVEGGA